MQMLSKKFKSILIVSSLLLLSTLLLEKVDCGDAVKPKKPLTQFRPSNVNSKRQANSANSTDSLVHEREFVSPQARVQLDCSRDKTVIKLNFSKPFNGIISAGKLETTDCKLTGNGQQYYELKVQHNATKCDTQWDSVNSSIVNTLFIRFHQSLETGTDLAKNVMCRLTVGDLVVGRKPQTLSRKPTASSSGQDSDSTGAISSINSVANTNNSNKPQVNGEESSESI